MEQLLAQLVRIVVLRWNSFLQTVVISIAIPTEGGRDSGGR